MPQALAGLTMEPSVSVPTATGQRAAATATAEPLLEPLGLRSRAWGLRVWPPRPLHPLLLRLDRKLAHSLRLVLPSTTAPAARRRATIKASRSGAGASTRAREPAVVCMRSAVSMLSLSSTGIPWRGPRTWPARRSASRAAAMARASGFSSRTAPRRGPLRSRARIRARCCFTKSTAVHRPATRPAWRLSSVTAARVRRVAGALTSAPPRAAAPVAKAAPRKVRRSRVEGVPGSAMGRSFSGAPGSYPAVYRRPAPLRRLRGPEAA